ncbi:MAG: S8 family serine peptidase [Gaiellaceae bacterium]
MRRTLTAALALAAALTLIAATVGAGTGTAAAGDTYIVQLADPPLASYTGGIAGLAATNPAARGEVKLDATSPASKAYLAHLDSRRQGVLAAMKVALSRDVAAQFTYRYAYNGFAAALSESEAAAVAKLPGVADVQKDYVRQVQTDVGPTWIGAPTIWSGNGGGSATKGEGVVAGIIDTGINHDHPSFADVGGDGFDHSNPKGSYVGLCDPITGAPFCNDKLIGVWDFTGTSPEDDNGHGSHTASTTAGNAHAATINAPTMSLTRQISGVAPHANIITYKACIAVGCLGVSLVAAIDQATADGVDVINYSIGGGPTDPWNDADSEAFLGARDAGVFVSASAGNSGPGPETVGSPANAPWLMSIGASTHNRKFANSLTNMSGGGSAPPADIDGKSFTAGYGPATIVYAGDYGDALCGAPFAPGTFDGEIVICDRGVNPRVEKGRNVLVGGAGGMVLANEAASGDSTIADAHELPAVHISYTDGQTLKSWVASGSGHTGTIAGTTADEATANGDVMASFSSRGPNKPVPSVIKPDVTAPGLDVLAAFNTPAEYGVISGTSMSSPHSAGAAALVRALHPDWTPAEVQSAIMSTAKTSGVLKEDGATAADPFDMGAGRVDLTQAGLAGLVLNETTANYLAANPAEGGDPSRLNIASLGNAECVGFCTWTRTVRSTLAGEATWSVRTSAPRGVRLTAKPSRFTLAPGASVTLTFTADVRSAPQGEFLFGEVRLSSRGAADAHWPVAVLPGGTAQPVEIETTSTTGTHTVSVTTPIEVKDLNVQVFGLTRGVVEQRQLLQDPTPLEPYDGLGGTLEVLVDVAAGSKFLAAAITETTSNDLDLFVGRDDDGDGAADEGEEVCRSASEIALESCNVTDLESGTYWVMVQNWLSGRVLDDVTLVVSLVPGTDAGNLTATGPKSAPAGSTFDVTLAWNEPQLAVGDTWFGLVSLGSDRRNPGNVGSLLVKLTRTG